MNKKELRAEIKEKISSLDEKYIDSASEKMQKKLISLPLFAEASSVFVYMATKKEPATSLVIKEALKCGKSVYVPKCISKGIMIPVKIDENTVFKAGYMNIPEPENIIKEENPKIDLAVLPCVSADYKGNRLGHGAGFYDIFLENTNSAKICLCFEKLVSPEIPTEEHDIKTDVLITEKTVLSF